MITNFLVLEEFLILLLYVSFAIRQCITLTSLYFFLIIVFRCNLKLFETLVHLQRRIIKKILNTTKHT